MSLSNSTSLTRGIVIATVLFMFGVLFLRRYVKLDWSAMGDRISVSFKARVPRASLLIQILNPLTLARIPASVEASSV